jgi:SRSO17 transposase
MQWIDEATDGPLPTTPDATVTSSEGGPAYLADMARRLAPPFARSPSRQRVMASRRGLLREAERKNSWPVAEACGEPTPDGVQYVLNRADWDADAVRDDLRTSVIQHLADPHGVLVLDETGCVNKRRHSAGVAR